MVRGRVWDSGVRLTVGGVGTGRGSSWGSLESVEATEPPPASLPQALGKLGQWATRRCRK